MYYPNTDRTKSKFMTFTIGLVIKEIRKNKDISINNLSDKTNIPINTLYAIESQSRNPNFATIKIISEALNVPAPLMMMKAIKEDKLAEKYTKIMETLYEFDVKDTEKTQEKVVSLSEQ